MEKSFKKIIDGYTAFRKKYSSDTATLMQNLADKGQRPEIMFVSCCDSRVDPALLLQCHPGDLFIARNIANLIPPYESDEAHHGTSAALEFGVCYLNVKHLVIMGHSQCGGIQAFLQKEPLPQDDFISRWTDLIGIHHDDNQDPDSCAKNSLLVSYQNALTFPWIQHRIDNHQLKIHLWFFDISSATIESYNFNNKKFELLA